MFLSEIFEQLTQGELQQLAMSGVDNIGIQTCDYPKILPHINLGLIELYKRFPLKKSEVVLQQYDHIQLYELNSRFAETNTESTETYKYIKDSVYYPFKDDVLRIEKVFNEDGQELFLNDYTQHWSMFTPSYNVLQVPWPEKENSVIVHYRASHAKIELDGLNPETTEVHIPPGFLEPLLLYVGGRAFSSLNSDQDAEGNNYLAKFEASCKKIEDLNLMNTNDSANLKLEHAGWV